MAGGRQSTTVAARRVHPPGRGRNGRRLDLGNGWHFYDGEWWKHYARQRYRGVVKTCPEYGAEFPSRGFERSDFCSIKCSKVRHRGAIGQVVENAQGYLIERIAQGDPLAAMAPKQIAPNPFVLQHRLVVARSLGRPLEPSEQVHHINGDRTDNRIENLQLRVGNHGKGRVARCACCGSSDIVFEEIA